MQNAELAANARDEVEWFLHSAFSLLHSLLSASIGSTRAARRADIQQAKSVTTKRTTGTARRVKGSFGATPKS